MASFVRVHQTTPNDRDDVSYLNKKSKNVAALSFTLPFSFLFIQFEFKLKNFFFFFLIVKKMNMKIMQIQFKGIDRNQLMT